MNVMTDKEWYEERRGDKMVKRKRCLCILLKKRGDCCKMKVLQQSSFLGPSENFV